MRYIFRASTETLAQLHAAIGTGKANATPSSELRTAFDMSARELRKAIELLRRGGAPILASITNGGGYYLPETTAEASEYLRIAEARIRSEKSALDSIRKYAKGEGA